MRMLVEVGNRTDPVNGLSLGPNTARILLSRPSTRETPHLAHNGMRAMVLPTPFERLLQETSQQAARDPDGAFSRLEELYGKSTTEQDVVMLGAFAVNLGVI